MAFYNCHAHVFNQHCAPKRFLNGYVSNTTAAMLRALTNFGPTRKAIGWLSKRRLPRNWIRPLSFLAIGSEKTQEDIFDTLRNSYPADTRLVVLTLNLEHMGAGESKIDYKAQLDEVLKLKRKYPNECLPFLCIDPRMNPQRFGGNNLTEVCQFYIHQGMIGIKLYPALGFYPNDPALYPVYAFAEQHQLPILMHCDRGGAFFRSTQAGRPPAPFSYPWLTLRNDLSDDDYSDNYLEPQNIGLLLNGDPFLDIPQQFPKLKICLAHFGSMEDILASPNQLEGKKNNWYEDIKTLILRYENVYTDISYTLHSEDAMKKVLRDVQASPKLANHVLFGTDFYLAERESPEQELLAGFRNQFGTALFDKLAGDNNRRFLTSSFYKAP